MLEGKTITMGGYDYVVPSLTMKQVRELQEPLSRLKVLNFADPSGQLVDDVISVAHAAISRNHKVDREELLEIMDITAMRKVLLAAMGQD